MAEYQDFISSLTGEEIEARLLAVPNKVDKEEGKGLSSNDYTAGEKTKLAGIEQGAEKNVNPDWNATSGKAQILNKPDLSDLTALVDRKAGALIDTASGAIASFVPDSTIDNLLDVSVDIEPVQDLHGYDHPWPAGGGKNQFGIPIVEIGKAWNGTSNSARAIAKMNLSAGTYTISINGQNTMDGIFYKAYSGSPDGVNQITSFPFTLTLTAEEPNLLLQFNKENITTADIEELMLQVETGSTATDYAPYSNECPISGWDSVEVQRTGKNLNPWEGVDFSADTHPSGVWLNAGDYVFSLDTGSAFGTGNSIYIKIKDRDGNVITDGNISGAGWFLDSTRQYYYGYGGNDTSAPFTLLTDCFFCFGFNNTKPTAGGVQLEIGSSPSAYKPYSGNAYTVQLGQTVYGGILDVTGGTMTAGKADQNVSAFTSEYGSAGPSGWRRFRFNTAASIPFVGHGYTIGAICDKLQEMNVNALAAILNNGTITAPAYSAVSATEICVALPVTTLADANAYLTSLGGLQFVYPLATPITIQLDPVTIAAISGQTNNVWADAGDVSVEFAADLKHYINSKIAAAVAAMS